MEQLPTTATIEQIDACHRKQAIDTEKSFIIQAPAGSGKTELLIQRYLSLLCLVEHPSQISAITFTKKASGEMRKRIQLAMYNALHNIDTGEQAHQITTRKLAKAVFEHAKKNCWHVENIAAECNIITIDAVVNQWLSFCPQPYKMWSNYKLLSQPHIFYLDTIKEFIKKYCIHNKAAYFKQYQDLLRNNHCDQNYIITIMSSALNTRVQWLPDLLKNNTQDLEQVLQENILTLQKNSIDDCLKISQCLINKFQSQLITMYTHLDEQQYLVTDNKIFSLGTECANWQLSDWKIFTQYLHTQSGTWKKTLQTKHGFLSKQNIKKLNPKQQTLYQDKATEARLTMTELTCSTKIANSITNIHQLPIVTESEWSSMQTLLQLLPALVAYLHLRMQEEQCTDYTAKAMQLHAALNEENPILKETLYQKLHHLLIDEFQDTSASQLAIFDAIASIWRGDDRRSITIVGDPMQSIYAFRQADVRLFEQVKNFGIGHIKLTPLYLRKNYRSVDKLITWNNKLFTTLQATKPEPHFLAALATKQQSNEAVQWHKCASYKNEATKIIASIKSYQQTNPMNSIAIIVKSRTQLTEILPALNTAELNYIAVDIDRLSKEQDLIDCVTLYMIAQDLMDRQHWIGFLRTPFVGLSWHDIYNLAHPKEKSIWENMQNPVSKLSNNAITILNRINPIIKEHLAAYQRQEHAMLSFKLWHALGGRWILDKPRLYESIEEFFTTLAAAKSANDNLNYTHCLDILNKVTQTSQIKSENPIQIMTVHKAKGLEFDCVICPGLNRSQPIQKKEIINCIDIYQNQQKLNLMHTQPKHRSQASQLQEYIRRKQQEISDEEQERLCYVAFTRAKKQLMLFYTSDTDNNIQSRSWMHLIAHNMPKNIQQQNIDTEEEVSKALAKTYYMRKLPDQWLHPQKKEQSTSKHTPIHIQHSKALRWGDIIHSYLHWLNTHKSTKATLSSIKTKLLQFSQQHGLINQGTDSTFTWLCTQIIKMHNDKIFQWIFKDRPESMSEQQLYNNKKIYRIDRYFIENNTLWIIDFKTYGIDNKEEKITKKLIENEQYRAQLSKYRESLQDIYPQYTIKTAIYFPLQQYWHAYDHEHISAS